MIECELKLSLDAAALARLKRHPALAARRAEPRRTETLVSVYYDTPDHALATAGVSLRLRRNGRAWVQTIKRRNGAGAAAGLFSNRETEVPAPGGRLVLDGPDPDGALAAVAEAAGDAPLSPVFETRIRRVVERLVAPEGGEVEVALDEGEVRAGDAGTPIREAEFELKSGSIESLYALARLLFDKGPVRFATLNKAAQGYRLARGEVAPKSGVRNAGTLAIDDKTTVEMVARDVFRDCLGQIADNMAIVAESPMVEGPHQLRVGLRRLRTAFGVFASTLGKDAMAPLSDAARDLGQLVGRLRDADVLISDVVEPATCHGLDAPAAAALVAALEARRETIRAEVRAALAAPESLGFLFDLGLFIEGRGWLAPADYGQTERLAQPIGEVAHALLEKRHRAVRKAGKGIRHLDTEALHDLRKELKKLRYSVDMFGTLYPSERVAPYLKTLKELQDAFGSLNDAAMAHEQLLAPHDPAPTDAPAQRGIGWVLGTLAIQVADDRPKLFDRWDRLHDAKPFWA